MTAALRASIRVMVLPGFVTWLTVPLVSEAGNVWRVAAVQAPDGGLRWAVYVLTERPVCAKRSIRGYSTLDEARAGAIAAWPLLERCEPARGAA